MASVIVYIHGGVDLALSSNVSRVNFVYPGVWRRACNTHVHPPTTRLPRCRDDVLPTHNIDRYSNTMKGTSQGTVTHIWQAVPFLDLHVGRRPPLCWEPGSFPSRSGTRPQGPRHTMSCLRLHDDRNRRCFMIKHSREISVSRRQLGGLVSSNGVTVRDRARYDAFQPVALDAHIWLVLFSRGRHCTMYNNAVDCASQNKTAVQRLCK